MFDLYAELEVSRTASVATIEAAYRSLAKRVHPDVARPEVARAEVTRADAARAALLDSLLGFDSTTEAPRDHRIKRLNVAREWLTDPELRRRYDAMTAPRPPRAVMATPEPARRPPVPVRGVGVAGVPALPSPRHGLFASDAERTRWLAVAGLGASSLALVAVLALSALTGGAGPAGSTGYLPSGGTAGAADGTLSPSPAASGSTSPAIDPALLARLQAGAESTIHRLQVASRLGELSVARALLGNSAPGLTLAGLSRATFPSVPQADIVVARGPGGAGWVATAGTDTLTSRDGSHWVFDYGERPLAVYRRTAEHQPYFVDSGGRHEIDLRISSVVVTRSTVRVTFTWTFPSGADAAAYRGDGLTVVSIGMRSTVTVANPPIATIESGASTASLTVPASVSPATSGTIDVRIIHGPGAYGSVDTVFKLSIL